jgi:hypothetical protein
VVGRCVAVIWIDRVHVEARRTTFGLAARSELTLVQRRHTSLLIQCVAVLTGHGSTHMFARSWYVELYDCSTQCLDCCDSRVAIEEGVMHPGPGSPEQPSNALELSDTWI